MESRTAAFTLIELLVVVSIIAILAALLLPAIGMVRSLARVVTCGSQLRQINAAILTYAQDNEGRVPRMVGQTETYFTVTNSGEVTGFGLLISGDYLTNHRVLYCTDIEHRSKHDSSKPTSDPGQINARNNYRNRLPDYVAAGVSSRCDFAFGWGYLPLPGISVNTWQREPTILQYRSYSWGYGRLYYWVAESFDAYATNCTYAIMPHPRRRTMNIGGTDGSVRMLPDWNKMLPAGVTDNRAYYWPKTDRNNWGFWRWVGAGNGF